MHMAVFKGLRRCWQADVTYSCLYFKWPPVNTEIKVLSVIVLEGHCPVITQDEDDNKSVMFSGSVFATGSCRSHYPSRSDLFLVELLQLDKLKLILLAWGENLVVPFFCIQTVISFVFITAFSSRVAKGTQVKVAAADGKGFSGQLTPRCMTSG